MNSKLHGLVQTEWRWLIAVYLFLAGAGGGAHITAVVGDFLGWMMRYLTVLPENPSLRWSNKACYQTE